QPKAAQPAGPGTPAPPPAQAAPEPRPTWMVNCNSVSGGYDCRASQTLFAQKTNQRILTLAVRTLPNAKSPDLLIQGPLGIYLPAGISIQIGNDKPKALPVQSCDRSGCVAQSTMTDEEIAALRGGANLTVTMLDLKKAPVKLQVPGLGFAAAYA